MGGWLPNKQRKALSVATLRFHCFQSAPRVAPKPTGLALFLMVTDSPKAPSMGFDFAKRCLLRKAMPSRSAETIP